MLLFFIIIMEIDMSNQVLEAIKNRRTIYAIGKNVNQSTEDLAELIFSTIEQSPSSFNSQSSRAVILFGNAHHYFWNNIVRETLRKIIGDGDFSATNAKINSFDNGFGTVLFFEDTEVIEQLEKNFPAYAPAFKGFSEQSNGMAEFAVWSVLAEEGIGASLQHYNPIIDKEVQEYWDLPTSWLLRAQLVFGSIEAPAGDKEILDRTNRFFAKVD